MCTGITESCGPLCAYVAPGTVFNSSYRCTELELSRPIYGLRRDFDICFALYCFGISANFYYFISVEVCGCNDNFGGGWLVYLATWSAKNLVRDILAWEKFLTAVYQSESPNSVNGRERAFKFPLYQSYKRCNMLFDE